MAHNNFRTTLTTKFSPLVNIDVAAYTFCVSPRNGLIEGIIFEALFDNTILWEEWLRPSNHSDPVAFPGTTQHVLE